MWERCTNSGVLFTFQLYRMSQDGVSEESGHISEWENNECIDREGDMAAREFLHSRDDRRGPEEACIVFDKEDTEQEAEKRRRRHIEWCKERIEHDCKSLSKDMLWMCANNIMDEIQRMTSMLCPFTLFEEEENAYWMANNIEWNEIAGEIGDEADEMVKQLVQRIKTWAHSNVIGAFMAVEGNK